MKKSLTKSIRIEELLVYWCKQIHHKKIYGYETGRLTGVII